jgi:hypothetical protein
VVKVGSKQDTALGSMQQRKEAERVTVLWQKSDVDTGKAAYGGSSKLLCLSN